MLAALIGGQTNPKVLAQLARGRMRAKISQLEEGFTRHFTGHHAMQLTARLPPAHQLLDEVLARLRALPAAL